MTKTIKVDEETHKHIKEYMKEHGFSTFSDAVENAVKEAEGIIDETGWIVSTRDTLNGKARIKNTRISVLNVYYWHFEEELTIDEICEHYYVEKEGVKAAIDYIKENKEEIERQKKETEIAEKVSKEIAREKLEEMLE